MAVCPKCEKKIPFYHLGQMCPHCGVNVRFYNFDKNFYRDAKRAELSLAKINIFIAHLKASFIGSKLPIIRLCLMLLPLLSLLVPYASAELALPFVEKSVTLSALGAYFAFSDGSLNFILSMMSGGADAGVFKAMFIALAAIAAIALIAVIVVLLTMLAFASIKKMPKALCAFSIIGIVLSIAAAVLSFRFVSAAGASAGTMVTGKISFGYIVTAAAFAANFIINLLIIKKGYNIVYKEGDLERIEIGKKVKAGEIKLDDLPQPIVETEETRLIDLEIEKQQQLYHEKEGGDNDEEV